MHCGSIEEEDDIISSSSGSFSSSLTDHQRLKEQSLHSPLSLTASTTTPSLPTDSAHHSPAGSNSSPSSFLIRELEAPSGLNLLVAALDAQDPRAFRIQEDQSQTQLNTFAEEDSFSHHQTSDEDTGSEKRSSRRKSTVPETYKDESYWEKRKRNNEAAKRSREKRRINDMAMEARLMELSRENNLLKHELDSVKKRQLTTPTPSPLLVPSVPDTPPTVSSTPEMASPFGALSPHQASLANSAAAAAHLNSLGAARSSFLPNANGLAAAGLINPLLAMMPPAMLLQAAMVQQQQRPTPSPPVVNGANMKRFNSFSTAEGSLLSATQHPSFPLLGATDQRQQTPTTPSILSAALSAPTSPGPPPASSFSDGKQYLRYKLLERQLQQQNIGGFAAPSHGLNLLGSVISGGNNGPKPSQQKSLANNCQPPPAKRQRTTTAAKTATVADLIRTDADTSLSLKECLSSLAVSLISPTALSSPTALNGEKGCDTTSPSNTATSVSRTSTHSSPIGMEDRPHNANQEMNNPALQSAIIDDSISRLGDLLRARTHSDSSQSSAGISSHGSSTSTSVSVTGPGTMSPGALLDMEYRNSFSDHRRDSNNSDSGIVSDGASDRRLTPGSCPKRYRTDHERYMERRRRNNEAAKRCRANRRAMFEYRYQRAQELENENARLKDEMRQLSRELSELKDLLAKRSDLLCNEYVLQAVNKSREVLESARLKNLVNMNDLDDENRESKLSIVDEIKDDGDGDDLSEEADSRGARTDETPLDFTVKKEKA